MKTEIKKGNQRSKDPGQERRKQDHINLAFESQVTAEQLDRRFEYHPMSARHPNPDAGGNYEFLGKSLSAPLWISSMTGGTEWAKTINHNLARACGEFKIAMGLGSCRALLEDDRYFSDFNVRGIMGQDALLYANLGIAQIEELADRDELNKIDELVTALRADGLIIHVNPLQEWMQPEGDQISRPPIESIRQVLENVNCPIIVKEVGQGMGRSDLQALLEMPLAAIDFAANGGTNFSLLELLRSDPLKAEAYEPLTRIGHDAEEMVRVCNDISSTKSLLLCQNLIISGGIRNFLDGYYLVQKSKLNAVYGQASAFLRHARGDYQELADYVRLQIRGYQLASTYLSIKDE